MWRGSGTLYNVICSPIGAVGSCRQTHLTTLEASILEIIQAGALPK